MARGPGITQRKILLLLLAGASLSFASFSPKGYFRTLKKISRQFEEIDREALRKSINALYESKLVDYREKSNGEVSIMINREGKKRALVFGTEKMKIAKPLRWDKQWHIVLFDIPHSLKKARDAFRFHLKRLGFFQFQKSIFVFPFPCNDELDFLIELYDLRPFVRQMIAVSIDNELELKQKFDVA